MIIIMKTAAGRCLFHRWYCIYGSSHAIHPSSCTLCRAFKTTARKMISNFKLHLTTPLRYVCGFAHSISAILCRIMLIFDENNLNFIKLKIIQLIKDANEFNSGIKTALRFWHFILFEHSSACEALLTYFIKKKLYTTYPQNFLIK